jgi:hypothetical protein
MREGGLDAFGVLLPGIAECLNHGINMRIDSDLSARTRVEVSCSLN